MKLHIVKDGTRDEWDVWVTLSETLTQDLRHTSESFILATGATRSEALTKAHNLLIEAANTCGPLGAFRASSIRSYTV